MQVAKNLTLTKKRVDGIPDGKRVDKDKLCPSCEVRFFGEHWTFAYEMNVGNRSFIRHWCPFEQREVD